MKRILVTGANGVVGRRLTPLLRDHGHDVVIAGRRAPEHPLRANAAVHTIVGDLGPDTDWTVALEGRDTVVHLAAEVPRRGLEAGRYATANDLGTRRLLEQAQLAGVTRIVFLSSLFAATQSEIVGRVPDTPYGRSKRAAEAYVRDFAGHGRTGISLRAPLVYGEGAVGNWALLERLAALPFPLPFKTVRNRRNVIAVENLVGAILQAVDWPDTGSLSGTYAIADAGTVSLAEMLTWLRAGLGKSPGLLPAPVSLMRVAAQAAGQGSIAQSLLGDLWADTTAFGTAFEWAPAISSREAMTAAGRRAKAV